MSTAQRGAGRRGELLHAAWPASHPGEIGAGLPENTVFVGRRPNGEVFSPELDAAFPGVTDPLADTLAVRCEPGRNRLGTVDTMRRYIYIHGTPDREPLGASRHRTDVSGCATPIFSICSSAFRFIRRSIFRRLKAFSNLAKRRGVRAEASFSERDFAWLWTLRTVLARVPYPAYAQKWRTARAPTGQEPRCSAASRREKFRHPQAA